MYSCRAQYSPVSWSVVCHLVDDMELTAIALHALQVRGLLPCVGRLHACPLAERASLVAAPKEPLVGRVMAGGDQPPQLPHLGVVVVGLLGEVDDLLVVEEPVVVEAACRIQCGVVDEGEGVAEEVGAQVGHVVAVDNNVAIEVWQGEGHLEGGLTTSVKKRKRREVYQVKLDIRKYVGYRKKAGEWEEIGLVLCLTAPTKTLLL
jgi:hypothetical protein